MVTRTISDYLRGDVRAMIAVLDDLEAGVKRMRERLHDVQACVDDVMTLEDQVAAAREAAA